MRLKVAGKARLLDALADWGRHEALGRLSARLGERPALEGDRGTLEALNILLRFRTPMVARLLSSLPTDCLVVELTADLVPCLRAFDGRPARAYAAELQRSRSEGGAYVRRLTRGPARIEGPLLAAARSSKGRIDAPITVFEGCHRLAAWLGQLADGRAPYPLASYLVVTRHPTGPLARRLASTSPS
jgi:hypothetical protein